MYIYQTQKSSNPWAALLLAIPGQMRSSEQRHLQTVIETQDVMWGKTFEEKRLSEL